MPIIRIPDGRMVRFPDDMPREQIKDFISQKISNPDIKPLTEEQKAKPQGVNKTDIAIEFAKGAGQGLLSGLGRMASGVTLGATDWLDRRTGSHLAKLEKDLQQSAEEAGVGGVNQIAKFLPEMSGLTRGAGKLIMKGAKTIPAMIGKGTIEGGIYGATSSDSLRELPTNIIGGAVIGGGGAGALGVLGKSLRRFVPALNAEGKTKGLQEAFSDRESVASLKKGAKASQEISDRIANEMPSVKDSINEKMDSIVKQTIGERPNIEEIMDTAKKSYGEYASLNASNPIDIKAVYKNYPQYTQFQKEALEKALSSANRETNSAIGTLEHTHHARMAIDDMIEASKSDKAKRLVPSLMKIRNSLDDVLKADAGYKAIDEQFAQASRLKNAYELGQSASKKSKIPSFKNELERKAWLSGVNDSMQENLINTDSNYAKTISNNLGVLKKALNKEELSTLKTTSNQIRKEFQRASDLDRIVNKESISENRPFWREVLESIGSVAGSTITGLENALYGLSDRATANRILNNIADSAIAKKTNRVINQAIPTISAVSAKRMADYGK